MELQQATISIFKAITDQQHTALAYNYKPPYEAAATASDILIFRPQLNLAQAVKGKNLENPVESLIKRSIIDQFSNFIDRFCSIFRKHFISVLYFAIPILDFAPQINFKFLTAPNYQIQGDAGRRLR